MMITFVTQLKTVQTDLTKKIAHGQSYNLNVFQMTIFFHFNPFAMEQRTAMMNQMKLDVQFNPMVVSKINLNVKVEPAFDEHLFVTQLMTATEMKFQMKLIAQRRDLLKLALNQLEMKV